MSNISKMRTITESIAELNPGRATVDILKYLSSDPTFVGSADFCRVLSRVLAACNASNEPSFAVVTLLHNSFRNNSPSEAMQVELGQCGYQESLDSLPPELLSTTNPFGGLPPSSNINLACQETDFPSSSRPSWTEDLVTILSSPFADWTENHTHDLTNLLNTVGFDGPDSAIKRAYLRQIIHECSTVILESLDVVWVLDSAQERLDNFLSLSFLAAAFDPDYEFLLLQANRITDFSKNFPYRDLLILLRYLQLVATHGFGVGSRFVQGLGKNARHNDEASPSLQVPRTNFESFLAHIQDVIGNSFFPYSYELRQIEHLVSSGMSQIALTMLDHTAIDIAFLHKRWATSLRALAESLSDDGTRSTNNDQNAKRTKHCSFSGLAAEFDNLLPLERLEITLDLISELSVLNANALPGMATEIYAIETEVKDEVDRSRGSSLDVLGRLLLLIKCGQIFDQRLTVRCVRILRQRIENTAGSLSREIVYRLATLEVEALYNLGRDREVCECVSTAMERIGSGFGGYQQDDFSLLLHLLYSIINMDAENELDNFASLDWIEELLATNELSTEDCSALALACLRINVTLGRHSKAKDLANLVSQCSANKPKSSELLRASALADAFLKTQKKQE